MNESSKCTDMACHVCRVEECLTEEGVPILKGDVS